MGKTGKIIAGAVVALIAAIILVFVLVLQNLDAIIKQLIEQVGSEVTQTEVRVAEVKFTLKEARGEIRGLTIGNPPGYSTPYVFKLDEVAVDLDPGSLTSDVILIQEVMIDGASVIAEQKGTRTNVQDLMDNMPKSESTASTEADAGGSDVRLALQQFTFSNTDAQLKSKQLGDQSLGIPDISLSNIGDPAVGLSPAELASAMVGQLVRQVERAVTKHVEKLVKDAAKKELNRQLEKNVSEKDRAKLDAASKLFKKDKN